MPKPLDLGWLSRRAQDAETMRRLVEIDKWRQRALERNELPPDHQRFALHLGNHEIWVEASGAFCALEVYQEIFRDDDHFLPPGFDGAQARVVVDLGANHGFYALRVKDTNPCCRLVCVEPNPYVFSLLEQNVAANGLSNVSLVNKAVAAENEIVCFDLIRQIHSIAGKGLSEVERPWMRDDFVETVRVPGVTLVRLFQDEGIDEVDLLKMDVEGSEADAIAAAGSTLGRVKRFVIERHSSDLRERVRTQMMGSGFELVYEPDPECAAYYGDMYFVNRNGSRHASVQEIR